MLEVDEHKPVRVFQVIDNNVPRHKVVMLKAAGVKCHQVLDSCAPERSQTYDMMLWR